MSMSNPSRDAERAAVDASRGLRNFRAHGVTSIGRTALADGPLRTGRRIPS